MEWFVDYQALSLTWFHLSLGRWGYKGMLHMNYVFHGGGWRGSQVKWAPQCHVVTERQLPTAPCPSLRSIVDSHNQPCDFKCLTFIWFFYLHFSSLKIREDCWLELWGAGFCLKGVLALNKWVMSADSPESEEGWPKTCFRINICDASSSSCLLMYGFSKCLWSAAWLMLMFKER